jgi:SsrA-binding protein
MQLFAENRKSFYDYEHLDTFEAGVSLLGPEVKSIRLGRVDIAGAYVIVRDRHAYIKGAHIHPYQVNNPSAQITEYRELPLLLNIKELEKLTGSQTQRGLTIVVNKLYGNNGKIKAEISLARRKKSHDKRENTKKREAQRDMERTIKYRK